MSIAYKNVTVRNLLFILAISFITASVACGKNTASSLIAAKKSNHTAPDMAPLGVNLEGMADWMATPMFVDAMKTSRRFGTPSTPWDEKASVDANGYPTTDAGSCIITGLPHMDGVYHFSCVGKTDIEPVASQGITISKLHYDSGTNRTTADVVVASTADHLMLAFKNTHNGIKDIRLIRPGYPADTKQIFTNEFIEAIKPFQALRCMDYLASNGTKVTSWANRTKVENAQYTLGNGGPLEPMIALANASGKDLWINIPYQAADDYVREAAKLFLKNLNPERKIYLEYSNEVWNWGFPQANYNKEKANEEAKDPKSVLNMKVSADDDVKNEGYRAWKRVAERTLQIAAVWKEVYGEKRFMESVRPVLASQIGWPFVLQIQTDFIAHVYGPPHKFIYGIAGAPYFNMVGEENKAGLNKDQVMDALSKSVEKYEKGDLLPYAIIAAKYKVAYLGYEGGVDVGQGEQSLDAKRAAQTDPRMRGIMDRYFKAWYVNGGNLFMYFTLCSGWGKWGFWGLTDDLKKSTPKLESALNTSKSLKPEITAGIAVPGTISGLDYAVSRWGNNGPTAKSGKDIGQMNKDDYHEYLLRVTKDANYKITITSAGDITNVKAGLMINTEPVTLTKNGSVFTGLTGHLTKVLHTLRLSIDDGGMDVKSITLSESH